VPLIVITSLEILYSMVFPRIFADEKKWPLRELISCQCLSTMGMSEPIAVHGTLRSGH
jgi:hypothetical protein